MKYVRILCAVALVFALCSAFTMKDKEKAVYAFVKLVNKYLCKDRFFFCRASKNTVILD